MALFRRFFYRKPPDRLLEISERVYVFDCCFSTDGLNEDEYNAYLGGIVVQLQDFLPDASFMVFNFREGDKRSQVSDILSQYGMTVMDYPRQYENSPLLPLEMIHHFLRSSESWLSLEGQQNVLLMHCERGGWSALVFMLAGLLLYRRQYNGEQKTLEMVYKQAPKELLQHLSSLDPQPSQLRYLQYITRRNLGSSWPPSDTPLILDCVILRVLPLYDRGKACRPVVRIYGQDPVKKANKSSKQLFSTLDTMKVIRNYSEMECLFVKFDVCCRVQGDIILELIHLGDDLVREEMMFRVMFHTDFIRSNILMLSHDEVDVPWNDKAVYPKDFRVEVLFSDIDAVPTSVMADAAEDEDEIEDASPEEFFEAEEIFCNAVDGQEGKEDILTIEDSNMDDENQKESWKEDLDSHAFQDCFADELVQRHDSKGISDVDVVKDIDLDDSSQKFSRAGSDPNSIKDIIVDDGNRKQIGKLNYIIDVVEGIDLDEGNPKPVAGIEFMVNSIKDITWVDGKQVDSVHVASQVFGLKKTINKTGGDSGNMEEVEKKKYQKDIVLQRNLVCRSPPRKFGGDAENMHQLSAGAPPTLNQKSTSNSDLVKHKINQMEPSGESKSTKQEPSEYKWVPRNEGSFTNTMHMVYPPPTRYNSAPPALLSSKNQPKHSAGAGKMKTQADSSWIGDMADDDRQGCQESGPAKPSVSSQAASSSCESESDRGLMMIDKVSEPVLPPSPPPPVVELDSTLTSSSGTLMPLLQLSPAISETNPQKSTWSASPLPALPPPPPPPPSPLPSYNRIPLVAFAETKSSPSPPPTSSQSMPIVHATLEREDGSLCSPTTPSFLPLPPPPPTKKTYPPTTGHAPSAPLPPPPPPPLSTPLAPLPSKQKPPPPIPLPLNGAPPIPSHPPPLPCSKEAPPISPPAPPPPPQPAPPPPPLPPQPASLPPPPPPPLSTPLAPLPSKQKPPPPIPLPLNGAPPIPSHPPPLPCSKEAPPISPPAPPPPPQPAPPPPPPSPPLHVSFGGNPPPPPHMKNRSPPLVGKVSPSPRTPMVGAPSPPSSPPPTATRFGGAPPPPPPPPPPFNGAPPPPPPVLGGAPPPYPSISGVRPPPSPIGGVRPPPPPLIGGAPPPPPIPSGKIPPPPPGKTVPLTPSAIRRSSPPSPPSLHGVSPATLPLGGSVSSPPSSPIPPCGAPPPPTFGAKIPNAPLAALGKGRGLARASALASAPHKSSLKPLHWSKVTRVLQGSLWEELLKQEASPIAPPEFDVSEIESLFSAAVPKSADSEGKTGRQKSLAKSDIVHLIDLRRANNTEIMLSKVKMPLPDMMAAALALDEKVLDADQVENLIKFCPTKEEMETLKGYNGDKANLGKCEQYFLELMKVPRVESKLRVFSFKIQFNSQVSDFKKSLNTVNAAYKEVRNSMKLKAIMQLILDLGNTLNQGTARGSAVGFKLDSLLKLTDTRASNNKMTLMHYLCKHLAHKSPVLLNFHEDFVSLEAATKIQLKSLAEEMQAITKGLEKVKQELDASQNDGPVSETFRKTLKGFIVVAETEVASVMNLYSIAGRNADLLANYFGEDPARCPFEQVTATLLNFVRLFRKAHEDNIKQAELEKKKADKEAELEKSKRIATKVGTGT